MSFTITYPFTTPTNYNYDVDKIIIENGLAHLKEDTTPQLFVQDFVNDNGFVYDTDKAEFSGGKVQQKDQRPDNSTLYAGFPVDEDSNWADGSLDNLLVNGASWDNGKIDLTGSTGKRLNMPAAGNFDDLAGGGARGCIRFTYIPDYTGAPGVQGHILELDTLASNNNAIFIRHYGPAVPDYISIDLRDSSGLSHWMYTPAISLNQGQEYVFELDFDFTDVTGSSRFFIDGIQRASLNTSSWTRTNAAGIFKWGGDSGTGDFWIKDIILFSDVQHTTNHTGDLPYTYPAEIYAETKVELPQFVYAGTGSLLAFDSFATVEINAPRYVMNDLYWSGSAWISSNGSFAQANTEADVLANIETLPASDTLDIDVVFGMGSPMMECENLIVNFTGQIYSDENPTITFNGTFRADGLDSFVETSIKDSSEEIKYTLLKETVEYYWNGSAWVVSDGTYAQTCDAFDINDNADTFTEYGVTITVKAFLHTDDGLSTPELDLVIVQYDFSGDIPDEVDTCIVWGYQKDSDGDPDASMVTAILDVPSAQYKEYTTITAELISATPDAVTGYWELELVDNANMEGSPKYKFNVGGIFYARTVPDETTKAFSELEQ